MMLLVLADARGRARLLTLRLSCAMLASCGSDPATELFEAGAATFDASADAGVPASTRVPSDADSGHDTISLIPPSVPRGPGGDAGQFADAGSTSVVADATSAAHSDAGRFDAALEKESIDASAHAALDARALEDALTPQRDGSAPPDAATSDDALHDLVIEKLRNCAVVGTGAYYRRPIEDAFGRCTARCMLDASCAALKNTSCTTTLRDPDLLGCYANCSNLPFDDGFVCDVPVRRAWVCDLHPTCAAGEDEANCATFACTNGQVIPSPHFHCDGKPQCDDASDEVGCARYCPN